MLEEFANFLKLQYSDSRNLVKRRAELSAPSTVKINTDENNQVRRDHREKIGVSKYTT